MKTVILNEKGFRGDSMGDSIDTLDNTTSEAATQLPVEPSTPDMVRKIGKTTYHVQAHFCSLGKESLSDKIKRLLRNDVRVM